MNSRSPSRIELLLVLAAALVEVGCRLGCETLGEEHREFILREAGGAALHIFGESPDGEEVLDAYVLGQARNHGDAPCRLALYRHASEPTPADLPVLTADADAPTAIGADGVLVFEALLPAARDGEAVVREISEFSNQNGTPGRGIYLHSDDLDDASIAAWLSLTTCAEPDVEVDLQFTLESCFFIANPKGEVTVETVWP